MESPLTPALALAYLGELSTDVLGAVAIGSDGRRLAGHAGMAAPARALLDAAGGPELAIRASGGWVFGARSETVGIVLATGRLAVAGLVRHDVGEVARLLDGRRLTEAPAAGPPSSTPGLRALADAVHDGLHRS